MRTSLAVIASVLIESLALAQQRGGVQPQPARDVTVTAIPGVVASGAAGAQWTIA